jgi:HEAT repeat protein
MRERRFHTFTFAATVFVASVILSLSPAVLAQSTQTTAQPQIEKQQQRLASSDVEERRDALMRLGGMHLAPASRAALPALNDPSAIVRVTAAKAILALDASESAAALLPLLNDKDEFVRREVAYALGATRSKTATAALSDRLLNDKEAGVRGAAAVALGEIHDDNAVTALANTLTPQLSAPANSKHKPETNPFVLRAAAVALGQIKNRAGTPALISAVSNEKLPDDVRREAARSLGLLGDPSAIPALQSASLSADPFLAQLAHESLSKLSHRSNP